MKLKILLPLMVAFGLGFVALSQVYIESISEKQETTQKQKAYQLLKCVQYLYINNLLHDRISVEKIIGSKLETEMRYGTYFFTPIPYVMRGGHYDVDQYSHRIELLFFPYCLIKKDIENVFEISFQKETLVTTNHNIKMERWKNQISSKKEIELNFTQNCLSNINIRED